ncbi:MAG: cupin domain-containing protein [Gammaproteobacteria bacterium]|nr:cupin domain-containing protein [Gammaproteobacteria bacterium]MDH3467959.1 cupin domain-containing protein [Gammaproteobacteria bacterium]
MDPKFLFTDAESTPWQKSNVTGVEVKNLGTANGHTMELYRFAPNTLYPDHVHEGPEFVYMLDGEAVQNGQRLRAGWAGIAETGTVEANFHSGDTGCVFLAVYSASRYIDAQS